MTRPEIKLALSMVIFGTIGIIRRYIPLSSAVLACIRGLMGAAFLLIYLKLRKRSADGKAIRANLFPLILSGIMIGFNWILLFEAYNYTSVAVATLCYYMQPVFVILASPFILKEKLTAKKLLCTAAALAGMVLVSGAPESGITAGQVRGVILGLGAAVLYASSIITNKFIKDIGALDRTIVQLAAAGVILIPYIMITEGVPSLDIGPVGIVMTITAGIVHTGIAYVLYFGPMEFIPVQTIAIMSYLDPVVALILSVTLLKEPFGFIRLAGAALILAAGYISGKEQ